MLIIKRINKYQGLRDIDVFIEEKGLTSEYFNITGMFHLKYHKVNLLS